MPVSFERGKAIRTGFDNGYTGDMMLRLVEARDVQTLQRPERHLGGWTNTPMQVPVTNLNISSPTPITSTCVLSSPLYLCTHIGFLNHPCLIHVLASILFSNPTPWHLCETPHACWPTHPLLQHTKSKLLHKFFKCHLNNKIKCFMQKRKLLHRMVRHCTLSNEIMQLH